MIIEGAEQYSISQAVTTSAASINIVNHVSGGDGKRNNPSLVVQVKEAAAAAGAATVTTSLQTSDDPTFATYNTLIKSDPIPVASLTLGAIPVNVDIPKSGLKQYSRVFFEVAIGPLTAGKFSAFIAY
jgi:hypothetical protein